MNKQFPCLKGDFEVKPREIPGHLDAPFTALVTVCGSQLEIRQNKVPQNKVVWTFSLKPITPYERYEGQELVSDADLKAQIEKFITLSDIQQQTREYYDSYCGSHQLGYDFLLPEDK